MAGDYRRHMVNGGVHTVDEGVHNDAAITYSETHAAIFVIDFQSCAWRAPSPDLATAAWYHVHLLASPPEASLA